MCVGREERGVNGKRGRFQRLLNMLEGRIKERKPTERVGLGEHKAKEWK